MASHGDALKPYLSLEPADSRSLTGLPEPARRQPWVPIRSLAPRHRPRILAHLLALSRRDRYLRFGHTAADAQIERYVSGLNFERDEIFGIFNRRLQLIAVAHLAYGDAPPAGAPLAEGSPPLMAEFGVSVSESARGRGFGARLFERAIMHARNRGITALQIHALSENTAMLKIARNAGATVEREGGESQAYLQLPPDTLSTHMEQLFEHQAAEFDYQLKVNKRRFATLLDAIGEVKTRMNRSGGRSLE